MSDTTKRRPRFKRTNNRPIRLTDDDLSMMRLVARDRFRDIDDFRRELPHRSPKRLGERVRLLFDHGYLDKPREQCNDHTVGGTPPTIYALGNRGAQLLAEVDGYPAPKSNWTDKNRSVGRRHIKHTMRTADISNALFRLPRYIPTIKVITADDILAGAPALTRTNPRPWLWRAHVRTPDGSLRQSTVLPDANFGIDLTDLRKRYYFFAEADRGTEPVNRSNRKQTSVARKLETYLAALHTGFHRTHFGIGNARILIVTTSQQRIQTMHDALRDIAGNRDCSMFLFADHQQVRAALHLLAVQWRTAAGDFVSLIDQPNRKENPHGSPPQPQTYARPHHSAGGQ